MTSRKGTFPWLHVFYLLLAVPIEGAKILLVPIQVYTHCMMLSSVGQELANRGHDVVIFHSARHKHKTCYDRTNNGTTKIRPILFQSGEWVKGLDELQIAIERSLHDGEELSPLNLLRLVIELTWHQCSAVLSDQSAINSLKQERFDLAIVDGAFPSYCYFAIPYKLGIRYVTFSTFIADFVSGRPYLPSIVPSELTKYTEKITFFERLINGLTPALMHAVVTWSSPMDVVSKIAPELSAQDLINIVAHSELFLYNYDTVLSYTVPTMPNHILVGGIGTRPAAPLSGEIKEFYEKATNGVVLVSFGSSTGSLPLNVEKNLIAALSRLDIDVLWKYSETGNDLGKVKRVKWIPQNDLLGHPKTRFFVSHCGNNGVFEALYHGVPLLCTPIFADQFYHGIRVANWNAGITIPLVTSSEETLFKAMNAVLNNYTYRNNMKKASEIYHSRPENPRERAAFWIEHILRFGGDHLKSPAADMSLFTYLGYDVVCFILGCSTLALFLLFKTVLCLCRCCCRRKMEKMKIN